MCESLIFTDSESRFLMQVHDGEVLGPDNDGIIQNQGTCETAKL